MDAEDMNNADAMTTRSLRALDVVVLGATGFTGKLVVQYLAQRAPSIRLGLAGRSLEKLHDVRATLPGTFSEIPLLVCSGNDKQSLARVAVQTSVLINCVGPFGLNGGENVVEACVNNLTHYVDSTGEPQFYERVVKRFHERAAASGVCIVPACGLDSLVWDVGMYEAAFSGSGGGFNTSVDKVELYAKLKVIPTAGTIESALLALSQTSLLREIPNLWSAWYRTGSSSGISLPRTKMYPHYNNFVKSWVMPMPTLDSTVMRRTLLLLQRGSPVPLDVHLAQYLIMQVPFAPLVIMLIFFVIVPVLVIIAKTPLRGVLVSLLRRFGREGPTAEERAASYLHLTAVASNSKGGPQKIINLSATDPGYGTTAKWIAESALLLLDVPIPPSSMEPTADKVNGGGVLSPASCFGHRLLQVMRDQKTVTTS